MKRYEALAADIAASIRNGLLKPGDRLPSVRQASASRHVSPATVFEAYYLLEAQGLVRSRPRSGYYVAATPKVLPEPDASSTPDSAARPVEISAMVFDILRLYGVDLTSRALSERRATLERVGLEGAHWQVPPVYDDGRLLQEATRENGLEGVVSKRLSSKYHAGRRSSDWLKFPHRATDSVVVGGWRPETTNASRLGAVLVGRPTATGLRYLGRVGSGLTGRAAVQLLDRLGSLGADASPFADEVPRVDADGTRWVRPEVVVDVTALGATHGGRLRQPAYKGWRADLTPADLVETEG